MKKSLLPGSFLLFFIFLIAFINGNIKAQEEYKPGRKGKKDIRKFTTTLPINNKSQQITAEVIDNLVVYQGDIILGPLEKFENAGVQAVVIDGSSFRWQNATIPFIISPGHPETTDINSAITMVNTSTNLRLIPKTSQSDFIQFVSGSGCSSPVGRQGGRQDITIGNCSVGSIAHEILHAAGLFHEQSREDRDNFIRVNLDNIQEGKEFNFDREVSGATDIGTYDYGSIMHYGKTAFSKNGLNTIDIKMPPGTSTTTIGQRSGISTKDNTAINSIYSMLPVGASKTINVSANNPYDLTGIFMRSGQTYEFTTASPAWNNGSKETDCDGYPGSILDAARRHPDLNMMVLTGELFEQNNSSNYTGHYFRIGCGKRTHTVTKSGFLVCFANDILIAYSDNSRVVTLTVKRIE